MTEPPLLDREHEWGALDGAWARAAAGEPQLVVVWGRRRVGKTFLLSHFARGRRSVYFGATEQAEAVELGRLGEAVRRDLGSAVADLAGGGFAEWERALRFFAAVARDEPLLVVLDEVPYLARSTPGFASIVQAVWDHLAPGTRLMLVLAGSAVGTIEAMIGGRGPLRGRPTLSLRLDPLDPLRARAFLPSLEAAPFLEAYAACGGYPLHLQHWDPTAGTEANLERLAFTPGGILLEDAAGLLWEELSPTGGYSRVLAAIGRGRTRPSDIASEAAQRIEHPLETLVRSGFVRRSLPVGAPRRARPRYELADPYLAFWFGVLYSEIPHIEAGQGRSVRLRQRGQWERHLGWVFEETARAHAARLVEQEELPGDLLVGRWWAASGPPCEVDVLGLRGSRTALLGEARWQASPMGARDLAQLLGKLARVPDPIDQPVCALWSRGGATPELAAAGVRVYDAEQALTS